MRSGAGLRPPRRSPAHRAGTAPARRAAAGPGRTSGPPRKRKLSALAGGAVVLALLLGVRTWVAEPVAVDSDSMAPTLPPGSIAIVLKTAPAWFGVHAGDVVVLDSPLDGTRIIKRVVAVGGQTVEVDDAILLVDGAAPPEPYVDHRTIDGTHFIPTAVPPGEVFVMGDNRERSIDSRDFGTVPVEEIRGTVVKPSIRP
ncbi:signal peptidase I [Arthrobacter sp. Marseille-P9274]|uniref:signal peptidase I n=1 Tax=Arthrobacter sp. Marseille-P9274 TaxID=2866572 RepID=UPI0021C9663D|nr:signal peptidase I [Arthrobacter sp. Marseille-P9274]